MTKQKLAEKIVLIIEANAGDMPTCVHAVCEYLDCLEPINLGLFAQWGSDDEKSVPKDAWR